MENVLRLRPDRQDPAQTAAKLVWIDNDLRYSTHPRRAQRRLDGSLRQLAFTSRHFMAPCEWRFFADRLSHHLQATALGRHLASTSVAAFRGSLAG